MNILLVYPCFPRSFWSFSHALKIYGRKALLPPLGLLTVASMMPGSWNRKLVDMNVQALTDDNLKWADYVLVSGMAVQRDSAHEVTARCQALSKKVLGGGPLFTGEYALFTDVEHFLLNEAEPVIEKLVADMEKGALKRLYRSREYADMTRSPAPMWSLLDMRQYAVIGIQYTRGCPYDCEFCNVTALLGRKPRTKHASQILQELDGLKAAGWRGRVFFVDDNLIGNRPALKNELLPALIDWQKKNGPMPFCTQASINLADDAVLTKSMTDAGFDMVFVGIETTDPEALKECSKSQNRNRNLVADVKKLQRAGIEVQAGFIVGFDHDTEKSFQQQVDFIQASGIVSSMVGLLHAPPGTRLITRMWQEGRLRGHSTGNNTDGSTNIVPKMGIETLQNGYRWLLSQIFAPKPCYARIKTFLREFGQPKVRLGLDGVAMGAFLRSIWYLGVRGRERWQYWSLVAWTLAHRPELLSSAVRLAMCSHHYRRIWEEQVSRPPPPPLVIAGNAVESGAESLTLNAGARAAAV